MDTAHRRRSRLEREEVKQDAIAIALTAQVVVCVLLLIIAVIAKQSNEKKYGEVCAEYQLLATDPAASEQVWEELDGAQGSVGRLFASMEQLLLSLIDRFTDKENHGEQIIVDASEHVQEEQGTPADEQETDGFDFHYLNADVASLGQGGAYPVSSAAQKDGILIPPNNATFAQVLLAGKAIPPVTGLITSEFSYREHPISQKDDFHTGMDIAAEEGRNILAALPGEVVEVGESEIYGHYIILQHATNLRTFYAHCSEILAKPQMAIKQGECIAKVGKTGVATGPHLHFSVIVEGKFTDPSWILEKNIRLVE